MRIPTLLAVVVVGALSVRAIAADARSEERVHGVVMLEVLQGAFEHVVLEAPPAGVDDRERRRVLVDQEDWQAIRDLHH